MEVTVADASHDDGIAALQRADKVHHLAGAQRVVHDVRARPDPIAADHARQLGAVRLSLTTDVQNLPAQALYESMGWARDQKYHAYHFSLNS